MSIFKKKNLPSVRIMSLSNEDIAELSFYTRRAKEIEIDLFLWQDAIKKIKADVQSHLAVGKDEAIDWSGIFIDGKVKIVKLPEPRPIPVDDKKQEVKKYGGK